MRRMVSAFLWVLGFQIAATSGCNEVTFSNTAPLTLSVRSLDEPGGDVVLLEGAQLCQTKTAKCDDTNETGVATIELPIGEETSFTLEAKDHVSYLVPVIVSHGGQRDTFDMRTRNYAEADFGRLMTNYPMVGTGAILALRFGNEDGARATFELEGAAGVPFYADEDGWWSLDLTETTKSGRGGFVEVPPGDRHTIRAGGTAQDCSAWWGWPGEDENSYRFPVRENYLTLVSLLCL